MFQCVMAVTILVTDLAATEAAYTDYFGYTVVERAAVDTATAALWSAPAMAGKPYLLMAPASGADFRLRFIEAEPVDGYAALRTDGWNATELLVEDTDAMAVRLADSPFTIIGPPRNLSSDGNVRAMQVQGPSGEVVYLTRIAGERTRTYGSARSPVDRAFILVVGGRDHGALVDYYGERFGHTIRNFGQSPITVLSRALGLDPAETKYPMKLALLGNQYALELDGYPDLVRERPRRDGELPPGMAMVTFGVGGLDELGLDWQAPPGNGGGSLYAGRTAAVATGPAGEWLEFVAGGCPDD
ncbi:MAG: hypothetical protein AAFX58_08600 [Pseudomonadota bacterium]